MKIDRLGKIDDDGGVVETSSRIGWMSRSVAAILVATAMQSFAACGGKSDDTLVIDVSNCEPVFPLCDAKTGERLPGDFCYSPDRPPTVGESVREYMDRHRGVNSSTVARGNDGSNAFIRQVNYDGTYTELDDGTGEVFCEPDGSGSGE